MFAFAPLAVGPQLFSIIVTDQYARAGFSEQRPIGSSQSYQSTNSGRPSAAGVPFAFEITGVCSVRNY